MVFLTWWRGNLRAMHETLQLLDDFLQALFFKVGFFCAKRFWLTFGVSLLLGALGVTSFLLTLNAPTPTETTGQELWFPDQGRRGVAEDQEMAAIFNTGPHPRPEFFYLTHKDDQNTNLLTPDFVNEGLKVITTIVNTNTTDGISFSDVCYKPFGTFCVEDSIRLLFPTAALGIPVTETTLVPVLAGMGQAKSEDVLGGIVYTNATKEVVQEATGFSVFLLTDTKKVEDARKWEEAVIDMIVNLNNQEMGSFRIDFSTAQSLAREVEKYNAPYRNVDMAAVATVLLIVLFFLVNISCYDPVESLGRLVLGDFFTVILAIFVAFGIVALSGLEWTDANILIPMVMVTFATEDASVLYMCFEHVTDKQQARAGDPGGPGALEGGASYAGINGGWVGGWVMNVIVFSLGTLSIFKGARIVSQWLLCTICIDFLFEITLAAAFLGLEARRQARGEHDLTCCCQTRARKKAVGDKALGAEKENAEGVPPPSHEVAEEEGREEEGHEGDLYSPHEKRPIKWGHMLNPIFSLRHFFKHTYGPLLKNRIFQIAATLTSVGLWVFFAFGTTRVVVAQTIDDVVPPQSYFYSFDETGRTIFPELHSRDVISVSIGGRELLGQEADTIYWDDPRLREKLTMLERRFTEGPWHREAMPRISSWYTDFNAYCAGYEPCRIQLQEDEVSFSKLFNATLSASTTLQKVWGPNVVLDEASGKLVAGKFTFTTKGVSSDEQISTDFESDRITYLREVQDSAFGLGTQVLISSPKMRIWEWQLQVFDELFWSAVWACIAVALGAFLFLGSFRSALSVAICVAGSTLAIFGTFGWVGKRITSLVNVVWFFFLAMPQVFTVAYAFKHIVRANVSGFDRAAKALAFVGEPVLVGTAIVILATLPLLTRGGLMGIFPIVLGTFAGWATWHSLVVLPLLLGVLNEGGRKLGSGYTRRRNNQDGPKGAGFVTPQQSGEEGEWEGDKEKKLQGVEGLLHQEEAEGQREAAVGKGPAAETAPVPVAEAEHQQTFEDREREEKERARADAEAALDEDIDAGCEVPSDGEGFV
uniref:SSD domain-containing protein n=1 Tax=Chromera velia CCMP2878 TaxID=1169474 RepID=A0A0G4HGQ2_9ALVE|eukprot:Cvel_27394.t1-p1 / transcript=Cvel_27394.t1 / gene=Cvel_27394 / organism=Chromera_velia_CCMP2878 / gene_product=hypothetical protein / transcript_product=hypothetical protein / location=Cvel_scaffold3412:4943-16738(-) / protein_length=1044 / sequence_SO=supercontig / SO=protein_coding / is_pseudo=false